MQKASITLSCKLKAPPRLILDKFEIIHKVKNNSLRNINGILAMLDKQKQNQ